MSSVIDEYSDAPFFSLKDKFCKGKVVHVYDGDTVHVIMETFGSVFKWRCRIAHIDCPELRTRNIEEKTQGYIARDIVKDLLLNKTVELKCLDFDKYGRLLVEITVCIDEKDVLLHEWLISNNYAQPYEGKTKLGWK